MPEDALRYFPSRGGGDADGRGADAAVASGGGGMGNNETLADAVARLKAKMKDDEDNEDDDDDDEMGEGDDDDDGTIVVDYGNHNLRWDDGPSSWDEFGHDNDPDVCRMRTMTVEEWESGRHWRHNVPVMVTNVTSGWDANVNWELDEMLRRYPDAEATMGDGRRVGEIGPDAAGRLLDPTTVKVGWWRGVGLVFFCLVVCFPQSRIPFDVLNIQLTASPIPRRRKKKTHRP